MTVLRYMRSYGGVQSSIVRRITCSTLVEQRMDRPLSEMDENCAFKICARWARETSKKSLYSSLPSKQKKSESSSESSSLPARTPRSDFKF